MLGMLGAHVELSGVSADLCVRVWIRGDHECGQHRVVFRRGCEATAQHRHDHR